MTALEPEKCGTTDEWKWAERNGSKSGAETSAERQQGEVEARFLGPSARLPAVPEQPASVSLPPVNGPPVARILLSAGEVSGDAAGARVALEIRRRAPNARLIGVGGQRMREAGVEIEVETSRLASVGISEPFATLPALARMTLALRRQVRDERPHAALLIGFDLFHVAFARWLRRQGIPAISYFPPQIWLWRIFAGPIARSYDSLLTCFAEEQQTYAGRGGVASFVGHYLCDELQPTSAVERSASRVALGLSGTAGAVIGLLPGSRSDEVGTLLPVLLGAARLLLAEDPERRFVLPVAEPGLAAEITGSIADHGLARRVTVTSDSHGAMRACDLLLTASGTASLEATLLRIPMVIVCRIEPLSLAVVRLSQKLGLLSTTRVGIPNLLLRRAAVPELLQREVTEERVASEASALLRSTELRAAQIADLSEAAGEVTGEGAAASVADWVLQRAACGAAAGTSWEPRATRLEVRAQ
jgi:lipid-A-disaccharide synthase